MIFLSDKNTALDFDDVLLVPRHSSINHREDINLSISLSPEIELAIPIIASPMRNIISEAMIVELDRLGGLGIWHRFEEDELVQLETIKNIAGKAKLWGAAVGIGENKKAQEALAYGASVICIDVANGYLDKVLGYTEEIKRYIENNHYKALIMTGNVITAEGYDELVNAGADLVRVGIGSGNLCTTRKVAGVGIPQITAIDLCNSGRTGGFLVSDGGIEEPGDAVKAFAAGADLVMLGSLMATTFESSHDGTIFGMASRRNQEEYYHQTKSVEGIEKLAWKNRSLEDFIQEFTFGIRSGMGYLNANNIFDMCKNAVFVKVNRGSVKK